MLFPTYTQSETIFGNPLSNYQTRTPDNVIDDAFTGSPIKPLEPGENVYSYVMGLDDSFDPTIPLVVDGTDGTGHYVAALARHGGVWGGAEAIVIRLDNSGRFEKLAGPTNARYIPMGTLSAADNSKPDDNLLDVSRYGPAVRLLDPAIGTVR